MHDFAYVILICIEVITHQIICILLDNAFVKAKDYNFLINSFSDPICITDKNQHIISFQVVGNMACPSVYDFCMLGLRGEGKWGHLLGGKTIFYIFYQRFSYITPYIIVKESL